MIEIEGLARSLRTAAATVDAALTAQDVRSVAMLVQVASDLRRTADELDRALTGSMFWANVRERDRR